MFLTDLLNQLGPNSKIEIRKEGWNNISSLVAGFAVNADSTQIIELYLKDNEAFSFKALEFFKDWKKNKENHDIIVWANEKFGIHYKGCEVICILVPYALKEEFKSFNLIGQNVVLRYKNMKIVKKENE